MELMGLKAVEDGKEVCAVFFDFRKAFNSVPHTPLMSKLEALGLDVHITCWLNNYLANRSQSANQLYLLRDPLQRVECYKFLDLLISSNMSHHCILF